LAAGTQKVQDGIEDVTHVGLARSAARIDRDVWLDQGPLFIRYVTGIVCRSHPSKLGKHPLMGQSLSRSAVWKGSASPRSRSDTPSAIQAQDPLHQGKVLPGADAPGSPASGTDSSARSSTSR